MPNPQFSFAPLLAWKPAGSCRGSRRPCEPLGFLFGLRFCPRRGSCTSCGPDGQAAERFDQLAPPLQTAWQQQRPLPVAGKGSCCWRRAPIFARALVPLQILAKRKRKGPQGRGNIKRAGNNTEAAPAADEARRCWRRAPIFARAQRGPPRKPASARGGWVKISSAGPESRPGWRPPRRLCS